MQENEDGEDGRHVHRGIGHDIVPFVGLNSFMGPNTSEWNNIMAYATMYVTPVLAIFVLLQRRIVSGLTSGALK